MTDEQINEELFRLMREFSWVNDTDFFAWLFEMDYRYAVCFYFYVYTKKDGVNFEIRDCYKFKIFGDECKENDDNETYEKTIEFLKDKKILSHEFYDLIIENNFEYDDVNDKITK